MAPVREASQRSMDEIPSRILTAVYYLSMSLTARPIWRRLRIAFSRVCGMACLLLSYACDSPSGTRTQTRQSSVPTKIRPESEPAIRIPLGTIVSTSGQAELQRAPNNDQLGTNNGASNIYLVEAPSITTAVQASTRVVVGGYTAD